MTILSVLIIVAVLAPYFVFASGAWVSIAAFFKKRKPEPPKPQSVHFRDGALYYPPATHGVGQVVTSKVESPVAHVSETFKRAVLSNYGVGSRVRPISDKFKAAWPNHSTKSIYAPCPACGGKLFTYFHSPCSDQPEVGSWAVECNNCDDFNADGYDSPEAVEQHYRRLHEEPKDA